MNFTGKTNPCILNVINLENLQSNIVYRMNSNFYDNFNRLIINIY